MLRRRGLRGRAAALAPDNARYHMDLAACHSQAGDFEAAGGTVTDEMRTQAKQLAEREVALDEPDDVSAALVHAVSADVALRRYLVTPDKEAADRTVRALVRELVELNQWEQNGFSRDELVEMLGQDPQQHPEVRRRLGAVVEAPAAWKSQRRVTVDTEDDYHRLRELFDARYRGLPLELEDLIDVP